jgi:hypothetical protein
MKRRDWLLAAVLLPSACTEASTETAQRSDPKPPPAEAKAETPADPEPEPETKVPDPEVEAEPPEELPPPPDAEPDVEEPAEPAEVEPPPPAPEIEIVPWSVSPRVPTWAPLPDPESPLALVALDSGVLGKSDAGWFQLGEVDALEKVEMDVEPPAPIVGMWPDDAWFVQERWRKYDGDEEYLELRLMRLRGGKRWVPQVYSGTGEQWFHPGTDDELKPRMSTRSGMLVYGTFDDIDRVGGKHDAPTVGPHLGEVVDFVETGKGRTYVLSYHEGAYYAQSECEDDACVQAQASKFPAGSWKFGRQVPRGRYSVSVLASSDGREFVLHHRGKSGGWVLDELPAAERPEFTWSSQEGSLWTLGGGRLRLRDTEAKWFDVALPDGLSDVSVAVTQDRRRVVVSGVVDGMPKLFATEGNVEVPASP